jgi:pimeloyl-ACP methyl ester carboxylesterase
MKNYPLVLIHGYPFDHTMWYGVIAALGSGVRVYAPDLRGFGGTDGVAWSSKPSLDVMADDIAAMLDANQCGKAVIAGMSMGGYVALAFAKRHRAKVAGLGLISSQAAADSDEARAARKAMIAKVKANGPRVAAEALLPKLFGDANAKNPVFQEFAITGAEQAGVEGITAALEAMAARPDRTESLKDLEVPILIVHGLEDKLIPVENARALAQMLGPNSFAPVRGAGHATPIEAPDAVAQALLRLVKAAAPAAPEETVSNEGSK